VHFVKKHFIAEELIDRNGIIFHINRKIKDGQIQKEIRFTHNDKPYEFTEYVQALDLQNFKDLLTQTDMFIYKTFGNYQMEPYNPDTSDRLILICKRKI
jgi:hypothetical protein